MVCASKIVPFTDTKFCEYMKEQRIKIRTIVLGSLYKIGLFNGNS
jgi:hypothetical protein